MSKRPSKKWPVGPIFIGLCLTGCAAFYSPKEGDKVDLSAIHAQKQNCVKKIYILNRYGTSYRVVKGMNALASIKVVKQDEDPDLELIAESHSHTSKAKDLMLLTFLTLGVFPAYYTETESLNVEIRKNAKLIKTYHYDREIKKVAGLIGLLISPMSNVATTEGSGFYKAADMMAKEFVYDFATSDLVKCQPGTMDGAR